MKQVPTFAAAIIVAIAILSAAACQNPTTPDNSAHPNADSLRPEPKTDSQYAARLLATHHFIDSARAQNWIQRYKDNRAAICHDSLGTAQWVLPYSSESFNNEAIQSILNLNNCIGVRVFLGINDSNQVRLLLGGVDTNGYTLYIDSTALSIKNVKIMKGTRPAPPPPPPSGNRATDNKGLVEMGQYP